MKLVVVIVITAPPDIISEYFKLLPTSCRSGKSVLSILIILLLLVTPPTIILNVTVALMLALVNNPHSDSIIILE